MKIGDIEIPIVSDIEQREDADVDELTDVFEYNYPVKHKSSVDTILISGFLNEEMHSSGLSLKEQKSKVKSLRDKEKTENDIDYRDYFGYLLVSSVNFTDNADSRIINEIEIEARYFPWPKYYPNDKPQV